MKKTLRNLTVITSCTGYCGRVIDENGKEYNIMIPNLGFPAKEGEIIEVDVYSVGWKFWKGMDRKGIMHSDEGSWFADEVRVVKKS